MCDQPAYYANIFANKYTRGHLFGFITLINLLANNHIAKNYGIAG
jgi:hypothetical protein